MYRDKSYFKELLSDLTDLEKEGLKEVLDDLDLSDTYELSMLEQEVAGLRHEEDYYRDKIDMLQQCLDQANDRLKRVSSIALNG